VSGAAIDGAGATAQVAGRIGKGAYGGVWQAVVVSTKQEVVLKVVFPDPDLDPEAAATASPTPNQLNSFRREIDILAMVGQHPNVAGLLGITSDFRVLVLQEAMIDLHKMIKSQKRGLALSVVRRWSHELLAGTAYLHSISIMHRDLKPSNLLIHRDMTLKIGDFGLSCMADVSETLAVRREMCTVWYRAPELIMGADMYSASIDVWSCGIIILEMLVGRCPTAGRVEDVCKCPKPTHFNFNSDQLAKIFRLVGTPTDRAFLAQMHCIEHFAGWAKHSCRLEDVIVNALLLDTRAASQADPAAGQQRTTPPAAQGEGGAALLSDVKPWAAVLSKLLTTNPANRPSVASVLEHPFWASMAANRETGNSTLLDQGTKLPRAVSESAVPAAEASTFLHSLSRAHSYSGNHVRTGVGRSALSQPGKHATQQGTSKQSLSKCGSGVKIRIFQEGSDALPSGRISARRSSISEDDLATCIKVAGERASDSQRLERVGSSPVTVTLSAKGPVQHESIQQVCGRRKVLGPNSKVRSQQSSSSRRNLTVDDASQYRPTLPAMLTMRDRNAKILNNDRIRTDNVIIASGMHVGAPADREPSPKAAAAAAAALAMRTRAQSREKKIDADRSGMAGVDHHVVGKDQVVDDVARQFDMRLSVDTRRRSR